jgi:DNA-binding MurR/RpiR family transcriptional regulator
LKFYLHDSSTAVRFEIAGFLSKDSARDLEQCWETASSIIRDRDTIIDLSYLTGADPSGQELLRKWNQRGARLVAISEAARVRLRTMTDQPVTVLASSSFAKKRRLRAMPWWILAFLIILSPATRWRW